MESEVCKSSVALVFPDITLDLSLYTLEIPQDSVIKRKCTWKNIQPLTTDIKLPESSLLGRPFGQEEQKG